MRPLRYIGNPPVAREKGIDVRIALDLVRLARQRAFDAAIIVSQDRDLGEAVDELYEIAREQSRFIKVACAFVQGVGNRQRGINHTDWLRIDRELYDRVRERLPFYPPAKTGGSRNES